MKINRKYIAKIHWLATMSMPHKKISCEYIACFFEWTLHCPSYHHYTSLDWSKTTTHFSENSRKTFLTCYQASRQASKWTLVFLSHAYFSAFWVISAKYFVLFIWAMFAYFWFLPKFGSTLSIYCGKTFKRQDSFCICLRLVSVKNKTIAVFYVDHSAHLLVC